MFQRPKEQKEDTHNLNKARNRIRQTLHEIPNIRDDTFLRVPQLSQLVLSVRQLPPRQGVCVSTKTYNRHQTGSHGPST